MAPDRLASRLRETTQPIAAALWQARYAGLRWWSSFRGSWHTVVLFAGRLDGRISFREPRPLALDAPAVMEAAELLGMELG